MTAYRRVYDSRHLLADCQEPGSAPEPYARLPLPSVGLHCIKKRGPPRYLFKRVRVHWLPYGGYKHDTARICCCGAVAAGSLPPATVTSPRTQQQTRSTVLNSSTDRTDGQTPDRHIDAARWQQTR